MRILAFSDLHLARGRAADLVAASSEAGLVIGAGDLCTMRKGLDEAMAMLAGIKAPFVMVPGNSESVEELREAAPDHAHVLHGTGVEMDGLRLFGLGYGVPETPFGDWSCDLGEAEASAMLAGCEAADILITHSPPKGVADRMTGGVSLGSVAIREAVERVGPRWNLCGHIHDSWGERGWIGRTEVWNLGPTVNWIEWDQGQKA